MPGLAASDPKPSAAVTSSIVPHLLRQRPVPSLVAIFTSRTHLQTRGENALNQIICIFSRRNEVMSPPSPAPSVPCSRLSRVGSSATSHSAWRICSTSFVKRSNSTFCSPCSSHLLRLNSAARYFGSIDCRWNVIVSLQEQPCLHLHRQMTRVICVPNPDLALFFTTPSSAVACTLTV